MRSTFLTRPFVLNLINLITLTQGNVQTIKILITKISLSSCYLIFLNSKHSLQHSVLKHTQCTFFRENL